MSKKLHYEQRRVEDLEKASIHLEQAIALMNGAARSAYVGGLHDHIKLVGLYLKAKDILRKMKAGEKYAKAKLDKAKQTCPKT